MPPPPAPPGVPKYVSVAAAIEAQIGGEGDGGRLPSVRGIARQHGISVVTASRALQILRDKGLVRTIERSGCYRVPPVAERWAVCLRAAPDPRQGATAALVRAGFEALARREPMHLAFDAVPVTSGLSAADADRAAQAARADGVQGVFLLPDRRNDAEAAALVAACRGVGLSVVLLERNLPGRGNALAADIVARDEYIGAMECAQHLYSTGCRRVGLVAGSPVGDSDRWVAGYLLAAHEARAAAKKPWKYPTVVLAEPADGAAALAAAVRNERLDGVICHSDYTALGLIVELLRRGVNVPDEVGVVGFDDLPLGDLFGDGLTTYDFPADAIAAHAVRLMRDRVRDADHPPVRVSVSGRLIVRGSTVSM